MKIYGYSKTYGQGNHEWVKRVVMEDMKLKDGKIMTSNEGY